MDLGVSSPQIDNPGRGFSFRSDGPLDMRMDTTRGTSAAEWLATASVEQIANAVLYEGYILYPYRASALKNRCRWTIGGLVPASSP